MSWNTRPTCRLYPSPAGDGTLCEEPHFIPGWAEQPADYQPMLPLNYSGPSLMPAPVAMRLFTVGGKLFPSMDPNVGAFVQDQPLPVGVYQGNTHGQTPYLPVSTRPLTVGVSAIGSRDAIGLQPVPPFHGELT